MKNKKEVVLKVKSVTFNEAQQRLLDVLGATTPEGAITALNSVVIAINEEINKKIPGLESSIREQLETEYRDKYMVMENVARDAVAELLIAEKRIKGCNVKIEQLQRQISLMDIELQTFQSEKIKKPKNRQKKTKRNFDD